MSVGAVGPAFPVRLGPSMTDLLSNSPSSSNLSTTFYLAVLNGSLPGGIHYKDVFDDVFDDFKESLYTYRQPKNIVLMSIYVVVFLLAFLGNMLVILVIVANRSMRSVTNYFLLNLAVADLLVTFVCIPLTMGEMVYKAWIYGLGLCKATGYLQGVSIAASVLTIMGLALDRYLALSHPVKARSISTPEHARKVLVLIWLIAGSIMIPLVFVRHLAIHPLDPLQTLAFCHERWAGETERRAYDLFLFVFIYVVPGVVVVVSYSSTGCHLLTGSEILHRQASDASQNCRILAGRRRVARMLLALAGLFACSWLPYHIVSLYLDFQDEKESKSQSIAALSFALLLGHSHSAQNPILYCIMNSSLKRGMMALLACRGNPKGQSQRCDPNSEGNNSLSRRFTNSFRSLTPRLRLAANGGLRPTSSGSVRVQMQPTRHTPLLCHTPTLSPDAEGKGTTVIVNHLVDQVVDQVVDQPPPPPSPVHLTTVYMEKRDGYRAVVNCDTRVTVHGGGGGDEKSV